MRNRWWAAPVLAGGAVVLAACGSSASPSTAGARLPARARRRRSSRATPRRRRSQSGRAVQAGHRADDGQGQTIYWFAIDTPTKSNCTGSCATYWPPVLGKAVAASGTSLPHGFGTITRSGGQVQATYDGHPLYTYTADTAPGQVSGNGMNVSGGLWWAMTPAGSQASRARGRQLVLEQLIRGRLLGAGRPGSRRGTVGGKAARVVRLLTVPFPVPPAGRSSR